MPCLVSPGPIATPWWDEKARGGRAEDAPPPDVPFLSAEAVANACVAMLEQDPSMNVESVMLDAAG